MPYVHCGQVMSCKSGQAGLLVGISLSIWSGPSIGQDQDSTELAQQLSNPIASLISVPFQLNYDTNIRPNDEGSRYLINVQPVIPFSLNEDWNLISRTIVPLISQDDVIPAMGGQSGLGDIAQALFFSPKAPTDGGMIWGVGPQFLLPTATDDLLGGEKWGLGPTAVFLKQQNAWTYGTLIGHIASISGDDNQADINLTNIQPFLAYVTPQAVTYSVNLESSYNHKASDGQEWSIPVNLGVSKLLRFGEQIVTIQGGIRYWADSPDNGPDDWGARLTFTLLFPK